MHEAVDDIVHGHSFGELIFPGLELGGAVRKIHVVFKDRSAADDAAFRQLLAVFTRANNLAKKGGGWMIDPSLLKEPCEMALHAQVMATQAALPGVKAEQGLRGVIAALARLAGPINEFFDGVMVMAEDEELRATRLALLNAIVEMTKSVGDLSKLSE